MPAMGRILALLLGLLVTGFLAYHVMYSRTGADGTTQTPPERLHNAREAAKRIETEEAKHVEEVLQKTSGAEKE